MVTDYSIQRVRSFSTESNLRESLKKLHLDCIKAPPVPVDCDGHHRLAS